MHLLSLALFAALATALPKDPKDHKDSQDSTTTTSSGISAPGKNNKFGLIAIHSGTAVQNVGVIAQGGYLSVGGSQDASCSKSSSYATFYLHNGEAFLYTEKEGKTQQLWVDRSGMGQGVTGYTTGSQSAPRNSERSGFAIDGNGDLTFNGISPQACPGNNNGGYSLWWTTSANPGSNQGCISVGMKAVAENKPVRCTYSASS